MWWNMRIFEGNRQCNGAGNMSIDVSGQEMLPEAKTVAVEVRNSHPLLLLARALPWPALVESVVRELKAPFRGILRLRLRTGLWCETKFRTRDWLPRAMDFGERAERSEFVSILEPICCSFFTTSPIAKSNISSKTMQLFNCFADLALSKIGTPQITRKSRSSAIVCPPKPTAIWRT